MATAPLLLEIGCEEIPARWLAGLAGQLADAIVRALRQAALAPVRTHVTRPARTSGGEPFMQIAIVGVITGPLGLR